MTEQGDVVVLPATPERWPDVVELLGGDGERGCWCQYWRQTSGDFRALGPGGGRRALRAQVEAAAGTVAPDPTGPPPGLIAYLDDRPVGWVGFGPRPGMARLARSRTIPAVDDTPVWSIVCFNVRVGFRRRGVSKALLDGVVAFARRAGAPGLEAYPIDPEGRRLDASFSYVGFVPTFERAGFRRILLTGATSARKPRWLMRLDLP